MKKYKKYSKIETKNKKQVHKINKAEKKVDTENGNIFYLYLFLYIIFINKQIINGNHQLFIALTLFTHAVYSFNVVYSGRIIEKQQNSHNC